MNAFKVVAATIGAAGATALLARITLYAALSAQSQIFGRVLIAGHDPRELALTYDDGPNPVVTPELLDVLAMANIRATFFLIGRFAQTEASLTRRIADAGHVIGNHTMTHPWLAWQSTIRIREELAGCNAVLEDILGQPVCLFRPPHGARRPAVLRIARELGLTTVQWNTMANDWDPVDAATILRRVQQGIAGNERRGCASNILLHDGSDQGLGADRLPTVEATRQLLALYPQERFVTPGAWLDLL